MDLCTFIVAGIIFWFAGCYSTRKNRDGIVVTLAEIPRQKTYTTIRSWQLEHGEDSAVALIQDTDGQLYSVRHNAGFPRRWRIRRTLKGELTTYGV